MGVDWFEIKHGIISAWYRLTEPVQKIKNIISWVPFLWDDYDFQFDDSVKLIVFKLNKLANVIEENKRHDGWEIDVKEIRETISLFDKFFNGDNYVPKSKELAHKMEYNPIIVLSKDEEILEYYKKVREFEQESWNKAWDLIRDKGRNWWD